MTVLVAALSIALSGLLFLSSVIQQREILRPNRFWVGLTLLFAPWWPLVLLGHYLMWEAAVREARKVTPIDFKT